MARIRSLHPGQWTDEAFVQCSAFARLLALGLRNEADDQGVFEWKPTTIKMRLFPADSVDVVALLVELEQSGQIRHFEVAGKAFGAIRNFRKWQRPEKPNAVHPLPDGLRAFVCLSTIEAAKKPGSSTTDPHTDGDSPPTDRQPIDDQSTTNRRAVGEHSPKVISEEGGRRKEVVEGGTGKTLAAQPRARGLDPEVLTIIEAFDHCRIEAHGKARARLAPHATDTVTAQRWVQQGLTAALLTPLFAARHRARAAAGQEPIDTLRFLERAVAELGSPTPSQPQPPAGNVHTHPAAELEQRKAAYGAAMQAHKAGKAERPNSADYGLAYNRETQGIMLAGAPRPPIPPPQDAPPSAPEGSPERVA